MTGIVSTALLSIASFLVNIVNKQNWVLGLEVLIIFLGVTLSSLAILFFVMAFKTKEFREVFGASTLFKDNKYNEKEVDKYRLADKESFDKLRIEDYLTSNYENRKMITLKGKYLSYGQWLFGASIISVSVVLVSVLLFTATGHTNINFIITKMDNTEITNNSQTIGIAGPDQTVDEGSIVVLNATNAIDQNGNITSYSWTKMFGPSVNLVGNNTAVATFRTPEVTADTDLGFQVRITDSDNSTRADDTVVHLRNKLKPLGDNVPRFIVPVKPT